MVEQYPQASDTHKYQRHMIPGFFSTIRRYSFSRLIKYQNSDIFIIHNNQIMKTTSLLFFFCIFLLTQGCNNEPKQTDTSDKELEEMAVARGDMISQVTQMALASKLKEVVQEEGIAAALKFCNVNAYPIVDSLEEVYNTQVKRASSRVRNPGDTPNNMEGEIIEDYSRDMSKGNTPEVKIILDDDKAHYFKPIILSAELCLKCHGQPGSDVLDENYKIIKELYPDDNATGHKLGDLRGIWSISFDKDDLSQD
jgi:hypothetical protein